MKTFTQFILEASDKCNKSDAGINCPIHGNGMCPKVKPHKTPEQIALKHRLDISFIKDQLKMGIPIEHEHTGNKMLATDIALQHLDEIPDYYTRLKKMEASAKKEHKKFKDVKEEAVQELEQGLKKLNNTSYDSIDNLMRGIMKKHNVSAKKLHNDFVDKHSKTPDTWIKDIREETASGDESLHDWFLKSSGTDPKTGRKVKGWPQIGGKFAGAPCARQPGQTTKPKCGSSKMAAEMSPEEEDAAVRRKRREDPNPDRKGKAKMVSTHESAGEKDACYYKVKSRYKVWPSAYASGALVKCRKKGAKNWGSKSKEKLEEQYIRIQSRGTTYTIVLNWRGKNIITQMFLPQFRRPSKLQITDEIRKVYPNATVLSFYPSMRDPTQPLLFSGEKQ